MPAIVRRETTDFGRATVRSTVAEACASRCLIRSHWRSRMRTSTHEPFSFRPWSRIFRSPFASARSTSGLSGSHVPRSQIMTVPPPYSPSGITPSKSL
jgi:hypothetical protein